MSDKKDFSSQLIDRITEEDIRPKPQWQFFLKRGVIWSVASAAVVFGALSMAVVIYMVRENDWDLYLQADKNLVAFFFSTVPYFWLVIFIALVSLVLYQIKHTKRGYKHHGYIIVLGSVVISGLLGMMFYAFGLGKAIDVVFEENVSFYSEYVAPRHALWARPEDGVLAGQIIAIESDSEFTIITLHDEEWTVYTDDDVVILSIDSIGLERLVRMTGEQIGDFEFHAEHIKVKPEGVPFGPRGRHRPGNAMPIP